ncbi:MAG: HAMP domain-containing sensor histidine kinase [Candidatus Susulua stagnicola]|nr:HAMP domain-containing sensor histidine kinase [Candidatus Susulua stagnicola]
MLKKILPIDPLVALIFIFFAIISFLIFYILNKLQSITNLRKDLSRANKTIDSLDQQAKLIIKSDMELKLSQQEMESELTKLTLIKNLLLSASYTLEKDKIYSSINKEIINALGFKKCLILDFSEIKEKVNIGFTASEAESFKEIFEHKKELLKSVYLLRSNSEIYKDIFPEAPAKNILIAPIKARESIYAIFIVSDLNLHAEIRKSEEETFLIVCMYLSQCLDNIRLFEDIYHTKDNLERKIKERTNELVKSLREIEAISKTKSDFISSVSHELRTPLTSVKGFSSLLVDEKFGKLPEEARKRLLKIDKNVNSLMSIVNTLLDISRIESGKMEVKIAPFEITKLIKDVADFLSPQIQAKKLNLSFSLPQNLTAYLDKNLIERVLINLINNAIKFTPSGGKITLKCIQKDKQAIISVSDTGCGMEASDLEKIFQEFFRASHPSITQIEGSGLGLSLVKKIIDTHKEKIWVESNLGKGTTLTFTLRII